MADTKITALTAITTVDPANDVLPIVDVSDTSMAASGTTKKITTNQLLGASGTATLASATISGDLTVDTSTLKVDSANNFVGVGTTTGVNLAAGRGNLTIGGSSSAILNLSIGAVDTGYLIHGGTDISLVNRTVTGGIIFGVNSSTAMTLNSTGLGVGTSPSYKLQATGLVVASDPFYSGSTNFIGAILNNDGTTPGIDLRRFTGTAAIHGTTYIATDATGATFFYNGLQASNTKATSLKMTLDATGNLGIGVQPSAWESTFKAIQINNRGAYISATSNSFSTAPFVQIGNNGYYDVTNSRWEYVTANAAAQYVQAANTHLWYTAAPGAADAPITDFATAKMTLDASGNLILLSSNTPATLTTNGQLTVNATSNTNLRFSYRGSDGVTRVANITLA